MKINLVTILFLSILTLPILVSSAMAHAPLGTGDNERIETATVIPDPTKSWAIFAELHSDGDPQYYTFNITAGQKIHVMLYKSMRSEESEFVPTLVIIGPGIAEQGTVSTRVTIPSGAHARVVMSGQPTATYEPFSPSTFYSLSDETIDSPVQGTCYVVVYEQTSPFTGGQYGLAIGDRETYGIDEWILIPLNLLRIFQWEGQSLALVLAPMITTLAVGIILITLNLNKRGTLVNVMVWLGSLAGLLFIGSGVSTLYQMFSSLTRVSVGPEVAITLVFALIPVILGIVTLRLSLKNIGRPSVRKRIYFVVLGVLALFMWAGLLVGPALAIIASLMPSGGRKDKS